MIQPRRSNTNPVNWFEIPVRDFDKAKRFYESVLGLEDLAVTEMGPKLMTQLNATTMEAA